LRAKARPEIMNVAIRRLLAGALVGVLVLAPAAGAAQAPTTSVIVACFTFNNGLKKGVRRPVRPLAVTGRVRRATTTQSGARTCGILRILRPGTRCPPGARSVPLKIGGSQGPKAFTCLRGTS
jgi:hypothetical protein